MPFGFFFVKFLIQKKNGLDHIGSVILFRVLLLYAELVTLEILGPAACQLKKTKQTKTIKIKEKIKLGRADWSFEIKLHCAALFFLFFLMKLLQIPIMLFVT